MRESKLEILFPRPSRSGISETFRNSASRWSYPATWPVWCPRNPKFRLRMQRIRSLKWAKSKSNPSLNCCLLVDKSQGLFEFKFFSSDALRHPFSAGSDDDRQQTGASVHYWEDDLIMG